MPDSSYNVGNNDANKQWNIGGEVIEGEVVERVALLDQTPITVAGCKHGKTVQESSADFPDHDEIRCEECPLGWFVYRERN